MQAAVQNFRSIFGEPLIKSRFPLPIASEAKQAAEKLHFSRIVSSHSLGR
jgi:hypothetical protein